MIAKLIVLLIGFILGGVGFLMVLISTIARPLGYLSAVIVPMMINPDQSYWSQPIWYMYIAHLISDDDDGWWHPTVLMLVIVFIQSLF